MENQEKLYTEGFNSGYLIAKHEPELAAKLATNKNDHSDYFKGLVSGKKEFEMEKIKRHILGLPQGKVPQNETKTVNKKRGK